eukprot:EG_transcript_8845
MWARWALCWALWVVPWRAAPSPLPEFLQKYVVTHNIQQAPLRPYSSHECFNTGGDGKLSDRVVCLLHNVCFNPRRADQGIYYFEDPMAVNLTGAGSPKHFDNGTHFDFPRFIFCQKLRQLVTTTRAAFPKHFTWMAPAVHTLACPKSCLWFSHHWLDNIIPYFWAAQVAGAYDPAQFGMLWTPRDRLFTMDRAPRGFLSACNCKKFFGDWIWPAGLVHPNSSCALYSVRRPVCFSNLILGGAAFGYYQWEKLGLDDTFSGLRPAFRGVRDFVRYGLAGLTPSDGPARQQILIINKRSKRRMLNPDAVEAQLRACFPDVPVRQTFITVKPVEQLRLVNSATVVIVPSGTVAYSLLFAPEHTVMIQLDRYKPSENRSLGADQYVFMNAGLRFMAYSVLPSEVIISIPPGFQWGHRKTLEEQHHSFGNVLVDPLRMARLVFWALRSAQEMRSGDPRFAFALAAVGTPQCRLSPTTARAVPEPGTSGPPGPETPALTPARPLTAAPPEH